MSNEREEAIQKLIETAYRMLCYIPRAYESDGPRGEMEKAILAVKDQKEQEVSHEG